MSPAVLVFLICNCAFINAARILAVFPVPSISHQVVFRPIIQELVKRGHEVTVVTPDPAFPEGQAPANLTEIDVHDVSYSLWQKFLELADPNSDVIEGIRFIYNLTQKIFEQQMNNKALQELILKKKNHFDLLLAEACVRMTLALSHIFKVPVVQLSSFGSIAGNYEVFGAAFHPFVYPNMLRKRFHNLSFWEKLDGLYQEIRYYNLLASTEVGEDLVLKRVFGPDTPSIRELYNNVLFLLLNVHPIWENNRPVPPNIIFMGGVHQNKKKKLPQDIQLYLDSSEKGVIYVSFGTNVKTSLIPSEKVHLLSKVFSQLKYDVLLKWDDENFPVISKNLKISKWLPQSDLLRHPKIKLFITQGGLQSTDEAISAGVPVIGIPMLGDQWYNVANYERFKIGIGLEMNTLTEEKLLSAIKTVIEDKSYRQNIVYLREFMHDQPQTPLERAMWSIEHVLRHGSTYTLRTPAANMSWTEYYELEFILKCIALIITAFVFIVISVTFIWKDILKKKLKVE
ncbi:UDP-glucosyltransferase 2-like [Battus philenor]|uniref:UDP-glucosyltransferase 2-like n=1 Tax=Battus philenor TaxID=42288 RepID=UPI0035D02279